ncbi:MAG: winged helix-turn-helix transcriptional regulator [Thermomicrobiales bacterium]|nr:winged helix-turn-helix transcriptional regulator [Thermomicrobiales bacterium]MCO5221962.1 MarR family winged helix-turn-helix transcriptional regulator [Thermomicrobiales bacterium]
MTVTNPADFTPKPASLPCLCAATRRVDRLLNRIYDDALRPLGINTMQKSLLASIDRAPAGIDFADLSDRLAVDRSTLTRNLTTLRSIGYVSIAPHPRDRRRRLVQLTDRGKSTLGESEPLWRDAQQRVIEALGPDQAAAMSAMLATTERVIRGLE